MIKDVLMSISGEFFSDQFNHVSERTFAVYILCFVKVSFDPVIFFFFIMLNF